MPYQKLKTSVILNNEFYLEVDGFLIKGESGDEYTPPSKEEFEITDIRYKGVSITDLLYFTGYDCSKIEREILNKLKDK